MPELVRTILVPVDFSSASEEGARYAVGLAEALGAERVILCHALRRPVYPITDVGPLVDAEVEAAVMAQVRRDLESACHRYAGHEVRVEPVLAEGVPHVAILEVAEKEGADLLVMSTHGRTGLPHLLLGSVAEKLVRTSPIPVCTVRAQ